MSSIWNDELIEQLKKYWEKGLTTSEIGKLLGVTKNSVIGKVHRLNLQKRPSCIIHKDVSGSIGTDKSIKPVQKKLPKPKQVIIEKESKDLETKELPLEVKREVKEENLITLMELGSNMCHWPVGDPKSSDFHFCGHKTKNGATYCDFHKAMAHVHCTNGK